MINQDTGVSRGAITECKSTNEHLCSDTGDDIIACIFAINYCCPEICALETDALVYFDVFFVKSLGTHKPCLHQLVLSMASWILAVVPWSAATDIEPVACWCEQEIIGGVLPNRKTHPFSVVSLL